MRLKGYVWKPTGTLARDPQLDVVHGVILHVDGGNATSLYKWFDGGSNGIESHAFLPKSAANDKEQFRDTRREADANYKANSWIGPDKKRHGFLSLETQGLGRGTWNKYQIEGIKDFILQTHEEHDFPLRKCPGPRGHGVGYHILYPDWTNVRGKICPGPDRIKQFNQIIVPWMAEESKRRKQNWYVTKPGDTAPSVADHFGIDVWQLWRWNPGVRLPFPVGTRLRVR